MLLIYPSHVLIITSSSLHVPFIITSFVCELTFLSSAWGLTQGASVYNMFWGPCADLHLSVLFGKKKKIDVKDHTTLKPGCLYDVQTTTWVFNLHRRERMMAETLVKVWLVVNDSLKIMVCEWTSSHAFYIWHDHSHKGYFLLAEAFKRWSGHIDVKAEGILREVTLPVIPFKSKTKGRINERI